MAQGDVNVSDSLFIRTDNDSVGSVSFMKELKFTDIPSYFEMESKEDVLNALQAIETDVRLGKPINWNMLLPVVRGMRVDDENAPDCLKFVREILGLFERYQCKDAGVMLEVFLVMLFLTSDNLPDMDDFETLVINESFTAPYGVETEFEFGIHYVWNAVISANVGLLKVMLRFGMGLMTPYFTADTNFYDVESLIRCWPNQTVYPPNNYFPDLRMKKKIRKMCNSESKLRFRLVLRVLEIVRVMQNYTELTQYFVKCYRLFFDSIPEAYVTSVEVTDVLEKHFYKTYSTLIPEITETFERLLPKLAEVPEPRSLQHLCRIQVRQSLRQNLNLPHGVASLPLPTNLMKYIMLNDDGDYNLIIRTESDPYFDEERDRFWPESVMYIPEGHDYITTFLKNL